MSLNTALGIHASADGGLGVGWTEPVQREIATLKPAVIKFLSSHSPEMIRPIIQNNQAHIETVIVRAFLDWGEESLTAEDFVDRTFSDTERTVKALMQESIPPGRILIELHNEANLTDEGLNLSWQTGTDCLDFFAQVLDQYKAQLPDVQYGMGGLSPGFGYDMRRESKLFLQEMMAHPRWNDFDVHFVHLYTSDEWDNDLDWLDHCHRQTSTMPIWITEAAYKPDIDVPGAAFAAKCVELMSRLDRRPTKGVAFYCVSGSLPKYRKYVWCRSTNGEGEPWENVASRGIAAEIRRLRP